MMTSIVSLLLLLLRIAITLTWATPLAPPTISLDNSTFVGINNNLGDVSKFLGIPFAQPPVGDLRFRLPQPISAYSNGSHTVTDFGPACPQLAITVPLPKLDGPAADTANRIVNSVMRQVVPDDENCLTINVIKPANVASGSKLPVLAWIFGGAFEVGSPSMYDGTSIVRRSIALGQPVIYVSMNYRLSAFGFLDSKEVKAAGVGNLGLQDQREALRWIQKYIGAFSGDPTKVTIWGESAGAISASLHMLANGGSADGLFRAAFMQSGAPLPTGDITRGQPYYDFIVSHTGCAASLDTLACLRKVDYSILKAAVDQIPNIFSYQSLASAWLPRADGIFLTDAPERLVKAGKVANIPFISGNCDDEGTLFSLSNLNITTTAQFKTYVQTYIFPNLSDRDWTALASLYPENAAAGSPYGTGNMNALSPQYKRIASFEGDLGFQVPRRFFMRSLSGKQNMWGFLSKRFKALPFLGSTHGSDVLNVYGGGEMADYLIRFAATLDPNGKTGIRWPKYSTESPELLLFQDGPTPLAITTDNYREAAINKLTELELLLVSPM